MSFVLLGTYVGDATIQGIVTASGTPNTIAVRDSSGGIALTNFQLPSRTAAAGTVATNGYLQVSSTDGGLRYSYGTQTPYSFSPFCSQVSRYTTALMTNNVTLTSAMNGTIFINDTGSGPLNVTLPAIAGGGTYNYTIFQNAGTSGLNKVTLTTSSTNLYTPAANIATGGTYSSVVVGSCVTIVYIPGITGYIVFSQTGTWTNP